MELKHFRNLKVQNFLKEFRVMSNVVLDGVAEAIDEETRDVSCFWRLFGRQEAVRLVALKVDS